MQAYKKLKCYIDAYHYNQSALADSIGIKPSTLHMKLNGERKLSADEFISLCSEMGVECETIIDYEVPATHNEESTALIEVKEIKETP